MGRLKMYEMKNAGCCHGGVEVDEDTFNKIPKHACISGTTTSTKYLLGNTCQEELLKTLGVYGDMCYDWYRIDLIKQQENNMGNDININLTIKQGASEAEIAALVAAEVKKHAVLEAAKFPKWEELGNISGAYTTTNSNITVLGQSRVEGHNRNAWPTKKLAEACLALSQLAQLRDYVNGDWKPDWTEGSSKEIIEVYDNEIERAYYACKQCFLAFKDSETRNGFLEAYRDLIEIAKPLL